MDDLIVVGTSWGGLHALSTIIGGLPADFMVPMVVVQHRHRGAEGLLCELLQGHTALRVHEVEDKDAVNPGHIYLAPPDYHVLVEPGGFSLTTDPPVRYSRPSIDVTFFSAADAFAERAIGVVLTGANDDGAEGLRRIVDRGGRAIVQDPSEAESPIMPRAALARVDGALVLPLRTIAAQLSRWTAGDRSCVGRRDVRASDRGDERAR